MAVAPGSRDAKLGEQGHVAGIPVRNVWLLMLYASDLFRHIGTEKAAVEKNPDDIPDLVAEVLAWTVERRMKRNLSAGYLPREAVLGRVRGRIDLLTTERHQLLHRGKVACRFEDLTVNTARNRFVRAALYKIADIVGRSELAHRCRKLAKDMKRMGVGGEKPSRTEMSVDRLGRSDSEDQLMVSAAKLALDLALPTEESGRELLAAPDRDIVWMRKLYEKAVGGFYDVVLSPLGWKVHGARSLNWPLERKTAGIDAILPSMKTDVVLDHNEERRRIVIDTKFTAMITRGWKREESLRSGYIYQIYAYVRSQEGAGDSLAAHASGLLLHPAVGEMIDETAVIQGHAIRFATVDLGASAREIRDQLLRAVLELQV